MEVKMDFKIEPNSPENNAVFDENDTKLSEAIYTVFPLETEDAILLWGSESISLSYRYDISVMIDDIIEMLFILLDKNMGEWFVDWSSNTFAVNWGLKWFNDSLIITAQWREEFDATDYLKNHSVLRLEKERFLSEWGRIVKVLLANLEECGYNVKNLEEIEKLFEVNNRLSGR